MMRVRLRVATGGRRHCLFRVRRQLRFLWLDPDIADGARCKRYGCCGQRNRAGRRGGESIHRNRDAFGRHHAERYEYLRVGQVRPVALDADERCARRFG